MVGLSDLLKKTLSEVNSGYDAALTDLKLAVESVSVAIQAEVANSSLVLQLSEESASQTIFTLAVRTLRGNAGAESYPVAGFSIRSGGYPIDASANIEFLLNGSWEARLTSARDIEDYFTKMITNPSSALVLRLSLLKRKANS